MCQSKYLGLFDLLLLLLHPLLVPLQASLLRLLALLLLLLPPLLGHLSGPSMNSQNLL